MDQKYEFNKQNNKKNVREAELVCEKWLIKNGDCTVKNVANDENYYKRGIDLIKISDSDKIETTIDVKACDKICDTNNIFFEAIEKFQFVENLKLGWGMKKIDYIYYVDTKNWILYIIPLQKLQEYVYKKNQGQYRLVPHEKYKTLGFLISLMDIKSIIEIVDLKEFRQDLIIRKQL